MCRLRAVLLRHIVSKLLVAGLLSVQISFVNADSNVDEGPSSLIGKPAPPLAFTSYGSNISVDLNDLRGKMVVVDFFHAEKSNDTSGFDDVVEVEQKCGPKGVVILGVCMDENNTNMTQTLRAKPAIDWPIDFGGLGFANAAALQWKASHQTNFTNFTSFLRVDYIVAPDGTVLWAGQPAQLEQAVADQLKDHKPQLVDPGMMNDAKASLDKTQAALTANHLGEAYHDRKRIPQAALQSDDLAAEVKDVDDKLQAAGNAELDAIDALIASKDYATAVAHLKDLAGGAEGTPVGGKARQKLISLEKDPDARTALQAAEKNSRADEALKVAQKLQANKRDAAAYARFKFVVKNYPDSPAAKTATDAISVYDSDPEFKSKIAAGTSGAPATVATPVTPAPNPAPDSARAKGLLSLANSYRDSGDTDKAREKYQDVVTQFPGTPEAAAAKGELEKLAQ